MVQKRMKGRTEIGLHHVDSPPNLRVLTRVQEIKRKNSKRKQRAEVLLIKTTTGTDLDLT